MNQSGQTYEVIEMVPSSLNLLQNQLDYNEPYYIFFCDRCGRLSDRIRKVVGNKFPTFECLCKMNINPGRAIKEKRYMLAIDLEREIKELLETYNISKHIQFYSNQNENSSLCRVYGKINDGAIYKECMSEGDLSITIFSDGVA